MSRVYGLQRVAVWVFFLQRVAFLGIFLAMSRIFLITFFAMSRVFGYIFLQRVAFWGVFFLQRVAVLVYLHSSRGFFWFTYRIIFFFTPTHTPNQADGNQYLLETQSIVVSVCFVLKPNWNEYNHLIDVLGISERYHYPYHVNTHTKFFFNLFFWYYRAFSLRSFRQKSTFYFLFVVKQFFLLVKASVRNCEVCYNNMR